ncbi:MAG: isoprenylcysteine carboxylmethyltransferase family protein [Candidatus Didemnitutus sp.]|nr:isoprenylcysteine carboxylmethyltransferase family protein [Candidatus Didemnitutus sp.]
MRFLELRIPPLVVVLITGLLMWSVARTAPAFRFESSLLRAAAPIPAIIGLAIAMLGVVSFRRARTTVSPLKPETASALVVSGIYRWTRNPMYLGVLLLLASGALFFANALGFLFLPCFVLYLNRFQIAPEEAALAARFGAEFAAYRTRVRRWI